MAKFDSPVKVKRGDDVREVSNDATLNQLLWDGFLRVEDADSAAGSGSADLTPQQKAAATRKRNAAAKTTAKSSTPAEPTDTVTETATSGDTAANETTVGSNPS